MQEAVRRSYLILGLILGILVLLGLITYRSVRLAKERRKNLLTVRRLNKSLQKNRDDLSRAHAEVSSQKMALEREMKKKLILLSHYGEVMGNLKNLVGQSDLAPDQKRTFKTALRDQISKQIIDEIDLELLHSNKKLFQTLSGQFPRLTKNDLKLCGYIVMNLSIKDIAQLLQKSENSVKVAIFRLKRKLGLEDTNVTLLSFLNEV